MLAVSALVLFLAVASHGIIGLAPKAPPTPTAPPTPIEDKVRQLETVLEGLTRQVMLQQFFFEEKTRSDGNSGLKHVRLNMDGTKNFYEPTFTDYRFMAIHDHANFDRTVGLGELNPVMNGVEFRTRHNDYKVRMPSTTSGDFHAIEDIPYPDVPPSVTSKPTIEDQIQEMREYFRAFKDQNTTHRDYRPFFKPVLCYLEGAWTLGTDTLDEPFQSDRHFIDAESWFDLMDKVRFTSYTGSKSILENYAYLPTTIYNVTDGIPQYAQWNYRILCHPIADDLPTKYFVQEDDLSYRVPVKKTMDQIKNSRAVRYRLNAQPIDHFSKGTSILDDLMQKIPGKDNYPAELHDTSFGMVMEDVRYKNHTLINSGYYHRYFKNFKTGAMGSKHVHRGFSDAYLFAAQTTQPKIAPMSTKQCEKKRQNQPQVCDYYTSRYSYALPLEIIYLTPIQSWNPYNISYHVPPEVVTEGRRNGGATVDKAYNGTHYKLFYHTPVEFYSSAKVAKDPADTAKEGVGVLDQNGEVRMMTSSGFRIRTPDILGVGAVRIRYPIMPVHGEGSGVWKELNALKEMTMHMNKYASLYEEWPGQVINNVSSDLAGLHRYEMSLTYMDPPGEHTHDFYINDMELEELKSGVKVKVTTSVDVGHSHELVLGYRAGRPRIALCDRTRACWDGHTEWPTEVQD